MRFTVSHRITVNTMSNTIKELIIIVLVVIISIFAIAYTDNTAYITVNAYSRHFTVDNLSEYITETGDSILLENVNDNIDYIVTIDMLTSTIIDKKPIIR